MSLSTAAIGTVTALAMAGSAVWYVTSLQTERDDAVRTAIVAADGLRACNEGVADRQAAAAASMAAASAAAAEAAVERARADKAVGDLRAGVGKGLSCSAAVARSRAALGVD